MEQTPFINLVSSFSVNTIWLLVKGLFLIAFMVYVLFAAVIVSQVKQMASTIVGGFERELGLLSWIHLGFAILAFVLAFVLL